ncbi:MAG: N-acetyl-D-Glu racemase DgcA [Acidobacteriota bacterium]|nr:N-acetyl-D-Glu racemase DgcA [Acidobacteriota bacterium]
MKLEYAQETWPVAGVFRISRGEVTSSTVLTVELTDGDWTGRGEASPEGHFGESMQNSMNQLDALRPRLEANLDHEELQSLLPACAARNALDCALWDLEAKKNDQPAWRLAGLDGIEETTTAFTISLDEPEAMAAQAATVADRPLLKVKLGTSEDGPRISAVRAAAPQARLIVDGNEGWSFDDLKVIAPLLTDLAVELIEQPLPAAADDDLEGWQSPVPLAADESCLHRGSLDAVSGRYDFVNIKLDKTGGLTEALALGAAARSRGLRLMVGCMLGTSLAMAPAMLVAQSCEFVDLDGPLLLAQDRVPCIRYDCGVMLPPPRELWG